MYVKLFLVMGVSWLTEVISYYIGKPKEAFILTDAINILQGVFIFLIFICKRKTIKFLKKKFSEYSSRRGMMDISIRRNPRLRGRHQHSTPTSPVDSKKHNTPENYFKSRFDSSEIPDSASRTTDRSDSSRTMSTKSTNVSETIT